MDASVRHIFMSNTTANDWNDLLKSRGEIEKELEAHKLAVKGLQSENASLRTLLWTSDKLLAGFGLGEKSNHRQAVSDILSNGK